MTSRDDTDARPVIRDRRRIDPVTGKVREPVDQDRSANAAPGQAREPGRHVPRHSAAGSGSAGSGSAGPGGQRQGTAPSGARQAPQAPGEGQSHAPGQNHGQAAGEGPDAAQAEAAAMTQLAERTADLQRVQAEYANYRKRVERDRIAVREQALANVLSELLPVLDNIERAREHGELAGGFKSVAESLESAVTKLGLARYGDAGEPFDPNVHEALMHAGYSSDVTEPTCAQILQPGYKVGNRILRPARVAVIEPGQAEPGEEQAGQEEAAAGGGPAGDEQSAQRRPDVPQDRGS